MNELNVPATSAEVLKGKEIADDFVENHIIHHLTASFSNLTAASGSNSGSITTKSASQPINDLKATETSATRDAGAIATSSSRRGLDDGKRTARKIAAEAKNAVHRAAAAGAKGKAKKATAYERNLSASNVVDGTKVSWAEGGNGPDAGGDFCVGWLFVNYLLLTTGIIEKRRLPKFSHMVGQTHSMRSDGPVVGVFLLLVSFSQVFHGPWTILK